MLNNIILVGRLTETPVLEEERAVITIAVPRPFKNEDGEYETDFIPVQLLKGIAQNTCEYCCKGDIIGVKGRIQSNENGIYLLVAKITFLSSKKED